MWYVDKLISVDRSVSTVTMASHGIDMKYILKYHPGFYYVYSY